MEIPFWSGVVSAPRDQWRCSPKGLNQSLMTQSVTSARALACLCRVTTFDGTPLRPPDRAPGTHSHGKPSSTAALLLRGGIRHSEYSWSCCPFLHLYRYQVRTGSSDRVSALIFVQACYTGPPARAGGQKGGRSEMLYTTDLIPRLSHQRGSTEGAAGLQVWELIRGWFRFRDWPSAQGRQGKKGKETPLFATAIYLPTAAWVSPLCSTSGKLPCHPAAAASVPQDCNTSFKCVLFARSPYKNTSFPELVFTSVETRHWRSLADFRRGSLLNNLYLQRALQRPR